MTLQRNPTVVASQKRAATTRNPAYLSSKEETDLIRAIRDAEGTAQEMLFRRLEEAFDRLVRREVHKELHATDTSPMDFWWLHCEGKLGLREAVDGFDLSLGYRFSTYAEDKIRSAIQRALGNRLVIDEITYTRSYAVKARTAIKRGTVDQLKGDYAKAATLMLQTRGGMIYLDHPLFSEDGDQQVHERLHRPEESALDFARVEHACLLSKQRVLLAEALRSLDKRLRWIIWTRRLSPRVRRGEKPTTQKVLGSKMLNLATGEVGVSSQCVDGLEKQALRLLLKFFTDKGIEFQIAV